MEGSAHSFAVPDNIIVYSPKTQIDTVQHQMEALNPPNSKKGDLESHDLQIYYVQTSRDCVVCL